MHVSRQVLTLPASATKVHQTADPEECTCKGPKDVSNPPASSQHNSSMCECANQHQPIVLSSKQRPPGLACMPEPYETRPPPSQMCAMQRRPSEHHSAAGKPAPLRSLEAASACAKRSLQRRVCASAEPPNSAREAYASPQSLLAASSRALQHAAASMLQHCVKCSHDNPRSLKQPTPRHLRPPLMQAHLP